MIIEIGDLPVPVQRAVATMPAEIPSAHAANVMRNEAASCYRAISAIWLTGQWHQIHEQLALIGGYLTAATRLEEEPT